MYVYCSYIESEKRYSKSEILILSLKINISILKTVI